MLDLPAELEAEREALIKEIYSVFDGVSRKGGVSWSEAEVHDGYGSDAELRAARKRDFDRNWPELLDDEQWNPLGAIGGFIFLDAIGFRYYLPAAMIHTARHGGESGLAASHLTLTRATKPRGFRERDLQLEKWSLLNDRQRHCVARFIRYMIAAAEAAADYYSVAEWETAYERYWNLFE